MSLKRVRGRTLFERSMRVHLQQNTPRPQHAPDFHFAHLFIVILAIMAAIVISAWLHQ